MPVGETSIRIEVCARRPFNVPKPRRRCIVTSIHRTDIDRKNLICGCHTTRGVQEPYTLTEALRRGGACPSYQRAGQVMMGSDWGCVVSSQCVILTYLCFTEQKKKKKTQPCDSEHLYIRIAVCLPSRSGQKPLRGQLINTWICDVLFRKTLACGWGTRSDEQPPYHRI